MLELVTKAFLVNFDKCKLDSAVWSLRPWPGSSPSVEAIYPVLTFFSWHTPYLISDLVFIKSSLPNDHEGISFNSTCREIWSSMFAILWLVYFVNQFLKWWIAITISKRFSSVKFSACSLLVYGTQLFNTAIINKRQKRSTDGDND